VSHPLSQLRLRIRAILSSILRRNPEHRWHKVGFAILSVCLFAGAKFGGLAEANAAIRLAATRAHLALLTASGDTTVYFGPKQFVTVKSNNQINFVESFTVPAIPPVLVDLDGNPVWTPAPNQYTMRIQRVGGSLTTATVAVNGLQIVTIADFATANYIERRINPNQIDFFTNSFTVALKGAAGAGVTITIVGTPDTSVPVFGPKVYSKGATTPTHSVESFNLGTGLSAPYFMSAQTSLGATATITLNGVQVIKDNDFGTNLQTVSKSVTLLSGTNSMSIDVRGLFSQFITLTVTATDKTPPTLTIAAPLPNFVTNANSITVSGTSQDRTDTQVLVKGTGPLGVIATMSGTDHTQFSATIPLTVGLNPIAIQAMDKAGNHTDSTRTVTRDTVAPTLTVTSPADNSFTNQDGVTVSGSVSDASTTTVKVNGVSLPVGQGGVFTGIYTLTAGVNFLTITATDAGGNVTSLVRKVTQAKQPPVLTVNAPTDGFAKNTTPLTVTGTVTGTTPITVSANGVAMTVTGTSFSGSVPLVQGANDIAITATDPANNTTVVHRIGKLDTHAPVLTLTAPTDASYSNATTATVTGTATDESAFTVTVNGTPVTVAANGSFTQAVTLVAGANAITVTATDAATNATTLQRTVTQDRTPPALTVSAPADGGYSNASSATVSGTASDATPVTLKVNGSPVTLNADGSFSTSVPLAAGTNTISVVATDAATNATTVSRTLVQDRDPPTLSISTPNGVGVTTPYTNASVLAVTVTVTDATPTTVLMNGAPLSPDGSGGFSGSVSLTEGVNDIPLVVTDAANNSDSRLIHVILDNQGPVIDVVSPSDGAHVTTGTVDVNGTVVDATPFTVTVNGNPVTVAAGGTFTTSVPLSVGTNAVAIVATDAAANTSTVSRTVILDSEVPPGPDALPIDTLVHAPSISASTVTTPFAAGAFLYSGANPLQTGVAPGTIEIRRAAVVRGRVLNREGAPLSGVEVSVLDHPEFGRTETRASGQYDMALNGGGNLMLSYAKSGVLGALRSVTVPWNDYAVVEDVLLVAVDAQVTPIDLSGGTTGPQVARGSIQADADGNRQATVLFPQGTTATMEMPDGRSQPLSSLHVHATEYTVGEKGKRMMPAPLPPSSAYTYAVELTVDEAAAAGATSVHFSQTVPLYVDNFLGFPAGVTVPVGVLDRARSVWVADENGVVIKIVGMTDGLADIDTNGDGVADDATQLSARGITIEERTRLAGLYETGRSLWRIPLAHFSAIDANFPKGNTNDQMSTQEPSIGEGSGGGGASKTKGGGGGPNKSCNENGFSSIECETQVLGERISLVGTQFALHYRSDRAPGRTQSNILEIPLTDSVVPDGLLRVMLEVSVAGRTFIDSFPAQPNLKRTFVWDGKDAYGRVMTGGQPIMVSLGYVYTQLYAVPADQARDFGLTCRGAADRPGFEACILPASVSSRARQEEVVPRVWHGRIGSFGAAAAGLGGWTLDVHNAYDVSAKELYTGDGHRRRTEAIGPVITTIAGGVGIGHFGDGGPATKASMYYPYGVIATADGSLYVTEYGNADLRRVGPDGIISTVATGFSTPTTMSADASGRVYFIDEGLEKVFRFTPAHDGVAANLETIAGGGFLLTDGVPATQLVFYAITGVAVSPDGSLYIADWGAQLVWRVGTDGIATKFAGNMQYGYSGDGGPATQAQLSAPYGPAVGLNGEVYVLDGERIRRIGSDGIITTVAQDPRFAQGGIQLVVGPDGSIYISDYIDLRIHLLRPDGQLIEVAGISRDLPGAPDNSLATRLKMRSPWGISVGPDGSLYIADGEAHKVRVLRQALPGLSGLEIAVASQDGSAINVFDPTGLHLRTLDALTRVTMLTFAYDAKNQLTSVTDANNNVTTIQRDSGGNPVAIIGPFGQRTSLNLNADGLLSKVTNPAGEAVTLTYHPGGLLATETDPLNHVSSFFYDSTGRLSRDQSAAGGTLDYTRSEFEGGWEVTEKSSLGRVAKYRVEKLAAGGEVRTSTDPAGLVDRTTEGPDGIPVFIAPDGTVTATTLDRDLRLGMQAPIAGKTITTTPSGIISTVTRGRLTVLSDAFNPASLVSQRDSIIANGRVYRNNFVMATKTFTVVTPEGRVSTRQLDAHGRIGRDSAAGVSAISYQYDARGRVASVTQGSRSWTYTYGSDGRLASVSDPLSRSTSFGYDSAGRVVLRIRADGRQLHYAYDEKGNLTSLTPSARPAHNYAYDLVDMVEDYRPPASSDGLTPTHYSYNLDQQATQIIRPDGGIVQIGYDTAGRLQTLTQPSGQTSYSYSPTSGNVTAITAAGSTLGVTYDGSLVTGLTWGGIVGGSVGVAYDNNFRVAVLNVNGANSLSLAYDGDGLLIGAGNLTISRNASTGRVDSTRLSSVTTRDDLDSFAQWTRRRAQFAGTTLFDATYVRDTLGRITEITETVSGVTRTRAFAYDSAGRLDEVRNNGVLNTTYEYDASGNRARVVTPGGTKVGSYDDQDRMVSYGSANYAYTLNGELSTKIVGSDTTRYNYDALGNLKAATLPDATLIEYVVDGMNHRVGKKVNGVLVRGWLYQGRLNPIAELDGAGNVVTRFVYGTRSNVPDYLIKNGTTYRIITDHLGSVRLIVDGATGGVAEQIEYDEWGNVVSDTNPGFQPFGYAGGLFDTQTQLVRFGARDYDPATGRWTAKDPIGFAGGDLDLYGYVHEDPVNQADPIGECPTDDHGCRDALASAAIEGVAMALDVEILKGLGRMARGAELASSARAIEDAASIPTTIDRLVHHAKGFQRAAQLDAEAARLTAIGAAQYSGGLAILGHQLTEGYFNDMPWWYDAMKALPIPGLGLGMSIGEAINECILNN
jgi:RHS repeat-associated protein